MKTTIDNAVDNQINLDKFTIDDLFDFCGESDPDVELVRNILQHNFDSSKDDFDLNTRFDNEDTLLIEAVYNENYPLAYEFIDAGANPNLKNKNGYSALSYLLESNNHEQIKDFMETGARLNFADLPRVASTGIYNLYSNLLGTLLNSSSTKALSLYNQSIVSAFKNKQFDLGLKAIKIHQYKKFIKQNTLDQAFCEQVKYSDFSLCEYFISEKNVNINALNRLGMSPLIIAAKNDFVSIVYLLLDKGADVNIQDKFGHKAIDYAIKNENSLLIKLLKNGEPFQNKEQLSKEEQEVLSQIEIEYLLSKAKAADDVHNSSLALELCEQINALNPQSPEVIKITGQIFAVNDASELAAINFQKYLQINKDDDQIWFSYAIELTKINQLEESIDAFKMAIQNSGNLYDSFPARNELISVYIHLNRFEEAEQIYLEMLETDNPMFYEMTLNSLGELYLYKMNHIDKSIDIYLRGLEKSPNLESFLYGLESCYMEKGDEDKAKEYRLQIEALNMDAEGGQPTIDNSSHEVTQSTGESPSDEGDVLVDFLSGLKKGLMDT